VAQRAKALGQRATQALHHPRFERRGRELGIEAVEIETAHGDSGLGQE
jgi:hypothetical protein